MGGIKKAKGFSGGTHFGSAEIGGGAGLSVARRQPFARRLAFGIQLSAFCRKISSSVVVKTRHHRDFIRIVALSSDNSNKISMMVPRVGFEPTALGLEVLCSIQLSYQGALT